jgi:hypothetical protein
MSTNEDKQVADTLEKAEEQQRLETEARRKKENDAKDRSELTTIKARLVQQFQSPNSQFKGIITSPEEQNMIEDQARMILRDRRRKASLREPEPPAPNSSNVSQEGITRE